MSQIHPENISFLGWIVSFYNLKAYHSIDIPVHQRLYISTIRYVGIYWYIEDLMYRSIGYLIQLPLTPNSFEVFFRYGKFGIPIFWYNSPTSNRSYLHSILFCTEVLFYTVKQWHCYLYWNHFTSKLVSYSLRPIKKRLLSF